MTLRDYCDRLSTDFGAAWDDFWFRPRDPYTLGVLRILVGCMALYMHLTLVPDVVRFFAPGGLVPIDMVEQLEGELSPTYLVYLSTSSELQVAHWLGIGVLALFTVGLFTRVTAVLALIVVLSTINRAPMLISQVEPVAAMLMFYLCIGPSGACLSLDALRKSRAREKQAVWTQDGGRKRSTWANLATRLIQVHVAMLYAVMGLSKLYATQWWDGTGVWWLITRSDSRLVDLTFLHDYPLVINAWSHALVLFELCFAILIWHRLARPLLLWFAVAMWVLTGLLTGNLPFAAIMLVANLAFVSPEPCGRG